MKALILATLCCLFAPSFSRDPLCLGVPVGEIVLFPYPGDCSRYYECDANGFQSIHSCESGLWFNEALQGCDHPSTSGCTNIACPPGIVDFFPVAGDCSEYIECYNGILETHSCPAGLWFNAFQKRCVSAQDSDCGQYTSEGPTQWTIPPDECYGVLPGRIMLYPYPGDCNKFIECVGAQMNIMSCPPYLYFNYARQMCDQQDLSGCDDTTGTPPIYTVTPPPDDGFDDPRCADGNNDYWPNVECTTYIECYAGHGHVMDCPSGLYFDEDTSKCVDPSETTCGRPDPTDPPTQPTNPDWTPDPDCPWPSPDRYLFVYPGDCTKYLECVYGEKVVMDCPDGLWFNPTLLVCDYPYHSGCAWGS
ncbi:hypothetical protein Zmor_008431 [Zophobas morio]|uniref:Chitin-binding type-2 domain-containing protein n=1 Tax=Zophobas morio TaxID=2755281 RepID=A0AA38IVG8_9CUCU|nr:hypothetical protein Zmor_008431 [Zophobas morio]